MFERKEKKIFSLFVKKARSKLREKLSAASRKAGESSEQFKRTAIIVTYPILQTTQSKSARKDCECAPKFTP